MSLSKKELVILKSIVVASENDPTRPEFPADVYIVKESFLKEAMEMAYDIGINCEPSGIAGLALFIQMRKTIPRNKKILIVNTGNSAKLNNIL